MEKFEVSATSQPASQPPSQTAYGEYGEGRGEHEERGRGKFCTLVRKGGCSREKHREAGSRDKGGRLPRRLHHRPARVPFPYTVINEPIPDIKQPTIKVTELCRISRESESVPRFRSEKLYPRTRR